MLYLPMCVMREREREREWTRNVPFMNEGGERGCMLASEEIVCVCVCAFERERDGVRCR